MLILFLYFFAAASACATPLYRLSLHRIDETRAATLETFYPITPASLPASYTPGESRQRA